MKFPKILRSDHAQPTGGLAAAADGIDEWFGAAVLPLEPALMRFLRRNWRDTDEISDLRQEIYIRVYEAALREGVPAATPAFLFTCARNLLVDRARRAQVVPLDTVEDMSALLDQPDGDFSPEHLAGARGELDLLQAALNDLPPRCREVIVLRKIDGLSQKEIASQLGIAEGTVEKQITLGIRSLADTLYAKGVETAVGWIRRMHRGEPEQ